MSDAVLYEMMGHVAVITINQPDRRNALGVAVRQGLWDAWDRFEKDENARVAILTGVGEKAFCAGRDLKEMSSTALRIPPRGLAQGWFQGATEFTPDVQGLAVMLPLSGRPLSVAVAGPTFRMEQRMTELGPMLRDAVKTYLEKSAC